ncbi:hypothetical protein [Rhodanobacter sp. FW106-PBR-R2A-1-13]|uniref:hypothetical protein n=1 Tax=Rhodanobacter sp. FW106-PBR-R2A-1-13 TaxID=3454845 RepID=UPI0034E61A74
MIEIFPPPCELLELAPEVTAIVCTAAPSDAVSLACLALDVASGGLVPLNEPVFVGMSGGHACEAATPIVDLSARLGCGADPALLRDVASRALAHALEHHASAHAPEPAPSQAAVRAAPIGFDEMLAVMEAAETALLKGRIQ